MKVTLYETIMTFLGQRDPKKKAGNSSTLSAGVSLRDFFAAQAMNAMIIANHADICVIGRDGSIGMSKDAYIIADSMLKIREAS